MALPLNILYFGDYDPAGMVIPETSIEDIRGWCDIDFDVIRVGLNEGDNKRYNIPENFEKPGQFQWEALAGDAAEKLIRTSVEQFVDLSAMRQVEAQQREVERQFEGYIKGWEYKQAASGN